MYSRILGVFILLSALMTSAFAAPPPPDEVAQVDTVANSSYSLFIPVTSNDNDNPVKAPASCGLSSEEQDLANLMINHPDQGRATLTCDPVLAQVAREKALDMAARNYFAHTNPDGFAANYLVELAGYDLPSFYHAEPDSNNIESLAGGFGNAQLAFDGLLGSQTHRVHILGLNDFFAEQVDYGIGFAYNPNSEYDYYWVIFTARH